MPYFEVGRIDELVDSSFTNSIGSVTAEGKAFTGGSFERGFRTITPTGAEVKEIALNVAEPYSWFVDLQDMKIRNLAKQGFDTSQLTVDRGHSWYFEQYRQTGLLDASWSRSGTTSYIRNGRPQLSAGGLNSAVATLPSSNLESYAAVQYGRMAPSVGEFSLSTFLGELREGLPRLVPDLLTRAKTAKAAGGDYLNVEFGWKPLLNDVRSLADTFLQASMGLFRPFGATHRMRGSRPIETFSRYDGVGKVPLSVYCGNYGSMPNFSPGTGTGALSGLQGQGLTSIVSKTTLNQWVEGEFVYIPKAGFDPKNFLDRYETLASVNITPAVLWELAPWSWFVDWFAQIGQAIAAMEAGISNRVLSTYFYAMEDASATTKLSSVNITSVSGFIYQGPSRVISELSRRRRRRIRGNPFGFSGSSSSALNVQQMGILAALGLTKTR